jgi:hypothetical protein
MKRLIPVLAVIFMLYAWSSRLGSDGYELEYFLSAGNFLRNGTFSMPGEPPEVPGVPERPPGMYHLPRHNLLQVFLAVPFYLAGMPFNSLVEPAGHGLKALPAGSLAAVSLLNPLLTAAAVILLFLIGKDFGHDAKTCQSAAVAFAIGTMAWPYAGIGMEPLQITMMLLCFLMFLRLQENGSTRYTLFLALSVAALLHTKISAPIVALPVAAAGLLQIAKTGKTKRWRNIFVYCAITGLSGAAWILLYLFRRQVNYTPGFFTALNPGLALRNSAGLLISPGKSLFVYNPILLWCLPGIPAFFSRRKPLALILSATAAGVFLVTIFWDWSIIEESWGPRYLMPLVPILIIMGMTRFQNDPSSTLRSRKCLFVALFILSILVQVPGAVYPNVCLLRSVQFDENPILDLATWVPELSPVRVGWHLAGNRFRTAFNLPEKPLKWHYYRGFVGHGSGPAVTAFDTAEHNQPYTVLFMGVRHLQESAGNTDYRDSGMLFVIWTAVTMGLLLAIAALHRRT